MKEITTPGLIRSRKKTTMMMKKIEEVIILEARTKVFFPKFQMKLPTSRTN